MLNRKETEDPEESRDIFPSVQSVNSIVTRR